MQNQQKYIPTFDKKQNLTNFFLVVSDSKDPKGFVKLGNERVIEAARILQIQDYLKRKPKQLSLSM